MSAAGWVLGRMLGCPLGLVVAGGSTVTAQSPVVDQCHEGLLSSVEPGFGLILKKLSVVLVLLLPNGLCSQFMFQSLYWDTVLSPPVLTLLLSVLFTSRLIQPVRSRLNGRHEKQLAKTLAAQIEEECHLINKLCVAKKECAKMETLKNARLEKEPVNIPSLANTYRKLTTVSLSPRKEINFLVQELKKERPLQSIQRRAEMLKVLKFLEEVMRISTSQRAFTNQPGDQAPNPDGPFPRSSPSS